MTDASKTVNVSRDRGFSLLELLIVVAIILIISTIAIPSLVRSRQAANEATAVSNMRNLNTAEVTYSSSSGGFYGTMDNLITVGLVDDRYRGTMAGYDYTIALSVNQYDYTASAAAAIANLGRYDYYTTPDFVVRYTTITTRAPAGLDGLPVR